MKFFFDMLGVNYSVGILKTRYLTYPFFRIQIIPFLEFFISFLLLMFSGKIRVVDGNHDFFFLDEQVFGGLLF